ncbi:MAG: hypothetical protein MZV64_52725 [Ignavibacteriales bacterium]|nr:hypothetical protein [Ignavibacteriales bacterium]
MFQLFGRPARAGRLVRRTPASRLEAIVERTARGYLVKGTVSGRPGRIEVYRAPAPAAFLLNNWQSWGPMERATPATRFPELEAIVRDYSPYLFSPVPGGAPARAGQRLLRGLGRRSGRFPDLARRAPVLHYRRRGPGRVGRLLRGRLRGSRSPRAPGRPPRRSRPGTCSKPMPVSSSGPTA